MDTPRLEDSPTFGQGALWTAGVTKSVFSADWASRQHGPGLPSKASKCPGATTCQASPLCWGPGAGKIHTGHPPHHVPKPGLDGARAGQGAS